MNGTTIGTIPVTGTNTLVSAPVNLAVSARDKITIAIASISGVAADIGITTLWTPT